MNLEEIVFTKEEKDKGFEKMLELFKSKGEDALGMSHYDFAKEFGHWGPKFGLTGWKEFLSDGRITTYIAEEFEIVKQVQLRSIVAELGDSRSVGQAQVVNALLKLTEGVDEKSGPAFIYTYVPLSAQQEAAENIIQLADDPFLKEV